MFNTIRFFFFNDTATTEIYTLSLHDALPICVLGALSGRLPDAVGNTEETWDEIDDLFAAGDRKSTRLNSSHANISYAVFCLKKTHVLTHVTTLSRMPSSDLKNTVFSPLTLSS